VIEASLPRPASDWPAAALFAALSSRFGVGAEPLGEEALARLVEQARAGDTGARQALYEQQVDRVYRVVRGLVSSDADAEDVTQDAMLTVLTSLHRYTPRADARFGAWVTTIAVNTARRRFRRRRPILTETGDLPETMDAGIDPGDALDRDRRRRALLCALAELPERERLIVCLRYGAELNATEIGAIAGISAAAIRKILERARDQLGTRIDALLHMEGAER
jgi:RNA polymerase sigma-70 factor (ECF subfamily)